MDVMEYIHEAEKAERARNEQLIAAAYHEAKGFAMGAMRATHGEIDIHAALAFGVAYRDHTRRYYEGRAVTKHSLPTAFTIWATSGVL